MTSMQAIVSSIIKELKLDDDQITNIYNYGSWVYGTNHEKSDRDFLIIMKNTDKNHRKRLRFRNDFDYFHKFELHRINNCDITIHSCENFELLLEKNYLLAIECLFYSEEFILRNHIDYKRIYLSKYYNPLRLKQVAFYENIQSFQYVIDNDEDDTNSYPEEGNPPPTMDQFLCDAVQTTTIDEDRLIKYFFHGLRYLNIVEQLIQTKSIYDFKQVSYVLFEMKDILINNNRNLDFVIDYIKMKGEEYKTLLNELVPTTIIYGTFKVHITVHNDNMEQFLNICELNKLKTIFIHLNICKKYKFERITIHLNKDKNCNQLMASFDHVGIYPNIIQHIQTFIDKQFKHLNIIRIKIESSELNNGVPQKNIDKLLFWNKKSNYFEFHYKIFIESIWELRRLGDLCISRDLYLSYNAFKKTPRNNMYYFVTMRLFKVGRMKALINSNRVVKYLTNNHFPPVKVERKFVVYDSNIDLDNQWNHVRSKPTINDVRPRYRIGNKNRKGNRWSSIE